MSAVEMEIRLVDGSPQEQAAFDQPPQESSKSTPVAASTNRDASANDNATSPPTAAEQTDPKASGSFPEASGNASDRQTVKSIEGLSTRIGELIGALHSSMNQPDKGESGSLANTPPEQFSRDVATLQQQLAKKTVDTSQGNRSENASNNTDTPTSDDYRELRQSMIDLAKQFTPKWIAEPIEKLIQSFAPKATGKTSDRSIDNSATSPAGPTVESLFNSVAITANQVTVNGSVNSEQADLGSQSTGTESTDTEQTGSTATPASEQPKQSNAGRFTELRKSVVKRIESTRFGKAAMRAARGVRSTVRSAGKAIGRTRFGKAVASVGRRVAGSSFGKAIAGTAAQALGTGATTATAGTGAAAAGTAGTAVASVAGPVAVAVAAIGALAVAAKLGGDALLGMAGDLSDMSPDLARAKAVGERNTELNRLDRARNVGQSLGQIAGANNRLMDASEKLLTSILQVLVKLEPAIEFGIDTLTALVASVDVVVKTVDVAAAKFTVFDKTDDLVANAQLSKSVVALAKAVQDIGVNNGNQGGPNIDLIDLLNGKP